MARIHYQHSIRVDDAVSDQHRSKLYNLEISIHIQVGIVDITNKTLIDYTIPQYFSSDCELKGSISVTFILFLAIHAMPITTIIIFNSQGERV